MTKKSRPTIKNLKINKMGNNILLFTSLYIFLSSTGCVEKRPERVQAKLDSSYVVFRKGYEIGGVYKGLGALYVSSNEDVIQGYFQNYRGDSFSTIFLFIGKRLADHNNVSFEISTFYPGDIDTIKGIINAQSENELRMILSSRPPGGEFSLDGTSEDFEKLKEKKYLGFGYVIKERIALRSSSSSDVIPKNHLSKNDCFGVIGFSKDQVRIEYIGRENNVEGWVAKNSVCLLNLTNK